MDLMAVGRFLLLPDDDLNLAAVLKGPMIGFDDDDLFRLAYERGENSLWSRLVSAAEKDRRMARARWRGRAAGAEEDLMGAWFALPSRTQRWPLLVP